MVPLDWWELYARILAHSISNRRFIFPSRDCGIQFFYWFTHNMFVHSEPLLFAQGELVTTIRVTIGEHKGIITYGPGCLRIAVTDPKLFLSELVAWWETDFMLILLENYLTHGTGHLRYVEAVSLPLSPMYHWDTEIFNHYLWFNSISICLNFTQTGISTSKVHIQFQAQ